MGGDKWACRILWFRNKILVAKLKPKLNFLRNLYLSNKDLQDSLRLCLPDFRPPSTSNCFKSPLGIDMSRPMNCVPLKLRKSKGKVQRIGYQNEEDWSLKLSVRRH